MISFDLIICTYNRSEKVINLVRQISECNPQLPDNIIVVDASDTEDQKLMKANNIVYIHSNHKNQPFQRYLGAYMAKNEILVFMDDDIEIIRKDLFTLTLKPYSKDQIIASTCLIDYDNPVGAKLHNKFSIKIYDKLPRWMSTLLGNYVPAPGKISFLGFSGPFTKRDQYVEYLNGPYFSVRKDCFLKTYSNMLLELYEQKLGKGEDKSISILLNEFGNLYLTGETCIAHPATDSHYFVDIQSFYKRATISRYYLTSIYCQKFNKSLLIGVVIFIWYLLWRLIFQLPGLVLRNITAIERIKGYSSGLKFLLITNFLKNLNYNTSWEDELKQYQDREKVRKAV